MAETGLFQPTVPFEFISQLDEDTAGIPPYRFLPQEKSDFPGFSRFVLLLHTPERPQPDELRQYKALCDRLLPGTRHGSHLYTLVHLDLTTFSVTLSEYGEVIGGTTCRFIQAKTEPVLILEVLLLAVEHDGNGVCTAGGASASACPCVRQTACTGGGQRYRLSDI